MVGSGSGVPVTDRDFADEAVRSLARGTYSIADAMTQVPNAPGLYAVHATSDIWVLLGFADRSGEAPLYVGKAEDSLVSRDLKTHFASGKTGSSTVRRSIAALLHEHLDLHGVPRNRANPGYFDKFALELAEEQRLTDWMRANLALAVWSKPKGSECKLDHVETAAIEYWQPPINLDKVRHPSLRLKAARKHMSDEARAWASDWPPVGR